VSSIELILYLLPCSIAVRVISSYVNCEKVSDVTTPFHTACDRDNQQSEGMGMELTTSVDNALRAR